MMVIINITHCGGAALHLRNTRTEVIDNGAPRCMAPTNITRRVHYMEVAHAAAFSLGLPFVATGTPLSGRGLGP
jgi:hypothetical protein